MRFRTSPSSPFHRRRQRLGLMYLALAGAVTFTIAAFYAPPLQTVRDPSQSDTSVSTSTSHSREAPGEIEAPVRLIEFQTDSNAADRREADRPRRQTNRESGRPDPNLSADFDPQLLQTVRDNTVGIRQNEREAFFSLLHHVQQLSDAAVQNALRDDVQHVNLMTDPEVHRGEMVTIAGDLFRLEPFPASPNRFGLTTLYDAWIISRESGSQLYHVVATDLGAGLMRGSDQSQPVQVTGCFFKREGYRSLDGLHVAPTILARQISLRPSPYAVPQGEGMAPWFLNVAIGCGLIVTVTLISTAWSDRMPRPRWDRLQSGSRSLNALQAAPPVSAVDLLRDLEERERSAVYDLLRRGDKAITASANGHIDQSRPQDAVDLPTPTPPNRRFPR